MFGRIFGFGKVYSAEYLDSAKITIRHTPTTYLNNLYLFIFWLISERTSLLRGTISNTKQAFMNEICIVTSLTTDSATTSWQ